MTHQLTRVALYARVSTSDKDQNPENQLLLLRRETERAGDTIIKEYVDEESGGKATRRQFQQLLADAKKRRFDLVRVTALDRFSSEGIEAVFGHLATLDQCNVSFWSYHEPLLNTTGPMRDLYRAIIAWAAAYRNQRHSENVRLGQARKKAQVEAAGEQYQHGRRPTDESVVAEVRRLKGEGLSLRKIADATGVSVGTVHKYLASEA
ncbi:recombinase family protein [Hymenobacter sp. ASUV-10]|uniref:Recombinase family protein n=1 Tax=Hymenobacter aranciens TaxID=3063996 RepID=A0ABT9BCI3_9BACT|nr:recombinase family protein [Hymenobacter sp. ASUV-10]MDO7875986.1 recombinase family protein [Hymenobacter sp. ASUV-10]